MPDTAVLTVVAAVIGTTILLAVGLAAGFWAGVQAAVGRSDASLAEELTELKAEHAQCLAELAALNAGIRSGHEQSEVVGLIAHSSRTPLASELREAIDRMLLTMRALERRIGDLQEDSGPAVPRRAADEAAWERPASQEAVEPPPHPLRVVDAVGLAGPSLTTQEMSDVMGGRHRLGDSDDDMEMRRYPYDCVQQLAPCSDDEQLPGRKDYVTARCHSLSVRGVSFLWHEPPKFTRAVLTIGLPRSPIYMVVEVKAYKAVYMHGSVCYLVQCEFVSRLERATEESREPQAVT